MDTSLKVLVADDEEIVRKTVVDFLKASGHCVEQVDDGVDALTAMEDDTYDLLIADVRMPKMGGVALLAACRDRYPDLPVIVITGHGDEALSSEVLGLGALSLLTKPFALRDLGKILDNLHGSESI